jgi:hypothetical protein
MFSLGPPVLVFVLDGETSTPAAAADDAGGAAPAEPAGDAAARAAVIFDAASSSATLANAQPKRCWPATARRCSLSAADLAVTSGSAAAAAAPTVAPAMGAAKGAAVDAARGCGCASLRVAVVTAMALAGEG